MDQQYCMYTLGKFTKIKVRANDQRFMVDRAWFGGGAWRVLGLRGLVVGEEPVGGGSGLLCGGGACGGGSGLLYGGGAMMAGSGW